VERFVLFSFSKKNRKRNALQAKEQKLLLFSVTKVSLVWKEIV
jgi:hypothetical protein